MTTILIVEDDVKINKLIEMSLQTVGMNCFQAFTGLEAIQLLKEQVVDLIILDINLPDVDGFSLIEKLANTPVMYVTARDGIEDRVKGLNLGAEDYIVKPFAITELIARVHVVLRRYQKIGHLFKLGSLQVDLGNRVVQLSQSLVELTPQEYLLLEVLIQHKNMAMSREQLLQQAWGFDYQGDDRTVDVHIQRLRKKLKLEGQLKTVYKLGYRLEVNT